MRCHRQAVKFLINIEILKVPQIDRRSKNEKLKFEDA